LLISTYDIRGMLVGSGTAWPTRESGLVAHTHQLLDGLARRHPETRFAVTVTGGERPERLGPLRTPGGTTVELYRVATHVPQLTRGSGSAIQKDAELVRYFYDDGVEDPHNPVWVSLAHQYAGWIREASIHDIVLQNINPIIAVLKAIEAELLNPRPRLTGVIHDAAGAAGRFRYLSRYIAEHPGSSLSLVAVSESVRTALGEAGIPTQRVRKIVNGMDIDGFRERVRIARAADVFSRVRQRNKVPPAAKLVLMSARRVPWKGHEDLILAAKILAADGFLNDSCVIINGAGLLDSRSLEYEAQLGRLIARLGLTDKVFLLDQLSQDEIAACYAAAYIAVLPSREPEPFGYANIEAMLAGVPVIGSAHGGPLEYIEDGVSGILVPPKSPPAIAAAIRRLLHDPTEHDRIGRAGRTSASRFTLDAMVDAYESVICDHTAISFKGGFHDDIPSGC
jgi:glycosyltransferase involved in cell wall biosynthesis